ncbi:MAG: prolyl oligopeptidase family protein [Caulobacterales bacterium]
MKPFLLAAALLFAALSASAQPAPVTPDSDPYLWLEDIHGARALAWVEQQNARSLGVLKADPRYERFHQDALTIVNAVDRIPMPSLIGRTVYNFWQDPTYVHGLWRRTTQESYATANPEWETVLDLDALSKAEGKNWVLHGIDCLRPTYRRCLVSLSDGGEDADVVREFDTVTKAFVLGGFDLPRSKQSIEWLDEDTLILTRDWGPGTLTQSGYGFVIKTLKRGQALDQATEVFRGQPTDVLAAASVLRDARGDRAVIISRATDFFHTETYLLTDKGVVRLNLPAKLTIQGLLHGLLIFTMEQDWSFHGATYKAGSVVAFNPDELAANEIVMTNDSHLVFEPGPRQSVEEVAITADRVVASIYDNVRGSLVSFRDRGEQGWAQTSLPVAANSSVGVAAASEVDDSLYHAVENFLAPTHLWAADAATGEQRDIRDLPARFDASGDQVDQFEATSSDGTKIPYFVVHPQAMKFDGSNPTLLYAYGGFQVSQLPTYSANIGKLWLEHGGVFVLANIRGGGEFGPAWHEAGLKTHRQLIYDDFTAVAKDLIARKITSPRRLGIEGGSNGGLLMGVEFNQHPDLWRAVVIQVPLLDMLRFEKIGAGASWVAEYGSVSNPDEAAFLRSTSPYHNLKPGVAYPEPFFVTSTQDDRVTPVHARKMAAKMQEVGLPFYFFENTAGGHAASANLQERAERVALEFTYLTRKLMD